ncbi:MAG: NAD(P)-dependent oxidoreductase [Alphaproteobacteria bacterium]|nr:NAD(P)-dependent oxidoreductase [Alphaproteobacteria bacterium]MBP7761925.1 NAD(P)-dependent oxidoreductase [Alphaproteobacteria bacterium]
MMNVLVTGATGGLGRNLCAHLLSHGFTVRATGRNKIAGESLAGKNCTFISADLFDASSLPALVKDCDAVIHCAALSSPWGSLADFKSANVTVTQNLVEACIRNKVRRFVHVSTSSVYFNFKDRLGIKETDIVASPFANHYASTKYEAELEVQKAALRGLETVIIRPRGIFGPHDSVVLPKIIHAGSKKILPIPRRGVALVDMTYVENVAHALRLALETSAMNTRKIYNITNGDPWHVHRLVDTLFLKLGISPRILHVPYTLLNSCAKMLEHSGKKHNTEPMLTCYTAALLANSQTLDINAARIGLGYTPQISMDEGLTRFSSWWKEHTCN